MVRFFIAFCCFLCVVKEEPVIAWRETYRLAWQDFRAKPEPEKSAAAITASGLVFSYSITQSGADVVGFTTQVYAYFYPEQSWYKPERADGHVLAHEQLHFDITELYARKFRQQLSLLKPSNQIKSKLDALLKAINKQLADRQHAYDAESNYSRNAAAQVHWQKAVTDELHQLAGYTSKP